MPKDSQISVMPLPFRYHSPYMYVFSPRVSTRKSTKVFVKRPFTAPVFGQAAQEGKRGGVLQGVHVRASESARQVPGVPGHGGSSGQQGGASREERGGGIQGEGGQDDARPRFPRQHAASSGPRCGPVRHATTCTSRAWPGGGSLSRTLVSAPRLLTEKRWEHVKAL